MYFFFSGLRIQITLGYGPLQLVLFNVEKKVRDEAKYILYSKILLFKKKKKKELNK